jgi:hypothetical protein
MCDLIVITASFQQLLHLWSLNKYKFLNEVSDENVGEYSLDDGSVFGSDCTQLVTPGTHVISDSESDNDSDEEE